MDNGINTGLYTFVDKEGDVWDVTLTLHQAYRIDKSDFSAYFKGPASMLQPSEEFVGAMFSDLALMFAIIYCIVKDQADKRNLDQEAFVKRINSTALAAGKKAFREAVSDFFPERASVLSRLVKIEEKAMEKIDSKLSLAEAGIVEAMDEAMDDVITQSIAMLPGRKSSSVAAG